MKIKFFSLLSVAALFLGACGNKPAETTAAATATTTSPATTPTPTPTPAAAPAVSFVLENKIEGNTGQPLADVLIRVNNQNTPIAKQAMGDFQEIEKADFARYNIPTEATTAVAGFWAGLGTAFYAVQKDGKVLVFEGFQDEGQPEYSYKEVKAIAVQ